METLYAGRCTILPPRPTMARRLLARTNALWFAAAACVRACVAALGRPARRVLATVKERRAPALEPALTSSLPERRLTEPYACASNVSTSCAK